jgi:hypothetical protein
MNCSIGSIDISQLLLGLYPHQDSNLILRFVERFQGQEIDAYRVIQGKAFYP